MDASTLVAHLISAKINHHKILESMYVYLLLWTKIPRRGEKKARKRKCDRGNSDTGNQTLGSIVKCKNVNRAFFFISAAAASQPPPSTWKKYQKGQIKLWIGESNPALLRSGLSICITCCGDDETYTPIRTWLCYFWETNSYLEL